MAHFHVPSNSEPGKNLSAFTPSFSRFASCDASGFLLPSCSGNRMSVIMSGSRSASGLLPLANTTIASRSAGTVSPAGGHARHAAGVLHAGVTAHDSGTIPSQFRSRRSGAAGGRGLHRVERVVTENRSLVGQNAPSDGTLQSGPDRTRWRKLPKLRHGQTYRTESVFRQACNRWLC